MTEGDNCINSALAQDLKKVLDPLGVEFDGPQIPEPAETNSLLTLKLTDFFYDHLAMGFIIMSGLAGAALSSGMVYRAVKYSGDGFVDDVAKGLLIATSGVIGGVIAGAGSFGFSIGLVAVGCKAADIETAVRRYLTSFRLGR